MLQIHVALSLIGMVSGFVVLYGLLTGRSLNAWTAIFLVTTILTSVTGFPLEPFGFDPARAIGLSRWCCWRRPLSLFMPSISPAVGAQSTSSPPPRRSI
jgi:hypothetical protein